MGLYEDKVPKTSDKYVGIEIECFAIEDEADVEDVFEKYKLQDNITISEDISINSEDLYVSQDLQRRIAGADYYLQDSLISAAIDRGDYIPRKGYEFKVLAKQSELKDVLIRVGKALKEIKAGVNSSCGLHVHLDMRNRRAIDSVTKLLNIQPLMLKVVPKERRNNTFCMPVRASSIQDGFRISKYHTINTEPLEDLNTVEVRVHEGTVDTEEMYKWCKFLIQTIDGNFAAKPTRTTNKLPIRLRKYLNERIKAC